eukprot:513608_1
MAESETVEVFRCTASAYILDKPRNEWISYDKGALRLCVSKNKNVITLKFRTNTDKFYWKITEKISKIESKGDRAWVMKIIHTKKMAVLALKFEENKMSIDFIQNYQKIFEFPPSLDSKLLSIPDIQSSEESKTNTVRPRTNNRSMMNKPTIIDKDEGNEGNEDCCCMCLFWILILAVCCYLAWIMILHARLKNHRLRYNQLNDFDVYEMKWSVWTKYRISTQTMSILTFKQQIDYEYQYILGTFQNYSDAHEVNENVTMHQLSWNDFSDVIDDENLCIFQFSKAKCSDSFEDCFYLKNYEIERTYDLDLVYTPIKTYFVNIDSESVGSFFNGYMDVIMGLCVVIFLCVIISILFSINFDEEHLVNRSTYLNLFLVLISIIFGTYFLWINVLSFVPILFSSPLNWEPNNEFYASVYLAAAETNDEYSHSLIYSIGDYKAVMWVIGVVMNGVWWWTLMFSPFIFCCAGTPLLCRSCCGNERADNITMFMFVLIIGIILLAVCLMSIGNLVVFILHISMWNNVTYNVDHYFIQTLIAIGCVWIIVPIFGCAMMCISNKRRMSNNDDKTFAKKSIEMIDRL